MNAHVHYLCILIRKLTHLFFFVVFQKKMLRMFEQLKSQITEIKEMLQSSSSLSLPKLPGDCVKLPIETSENMQKFDAYLQTEKNFLSVVSLLLFICLF